MIEFLNETGDSGLYAHDAVVEAVKDERAEKRAERKAEKVRFLLAKIEDEKRDEEERLANLPPPPIRP
jgi:hypothetical protein